jgi:glucose-6-phosphate isomerase
MVELGGKSMEGLRLVDMEENLTITLQRNRGEEIRNPFESPSFKEQNRMCLDATYMFDAPGPESISKRDVESLIPDVLKAHQMLKNQEGDIFDHKIPMTGWLDLPVEISQSYLSEITSVARELGREIDAYVSLGIGGSYLGIEATFKALTHTYFNQLTREERGGAPEIYFLGQNMDPDFFRDTLDMLRGKRIAVNVISKSGTTTETAVAFRIIRNLMEDNWGRDADRLILVTTDRNRGALKEMAGKRGYRTFVVPNDIGGRFSVLSDVGLVGLAMANIDIEEFVAGFRTMRDIVSGNDFWRNPALVHAALRHAAWRAGKKIEVVATNSAPLYSVARWMEQLFPESEGHEGHGMWVSPSLYSEKLHANGQMVQEGERNILETFLFLKSHDNQVKIPRMDTNLDGLDFLVDKGMDLNAVNRMVVEGPAYAHYQGGVPNMTIEVPRRSAFNLGQLYYMMETSVAISGYLLGHNPFIQPGVEAYKRAMFALIEKPGFEEDAQTIKSELKNRERIRI